MNCFDSICPLNYESSVMWCIQITQIVLNNLFISSVFLHFQWTLCSITVYCNMHHVAMYCVIIVSSPMYPDSYHIVKSLPTLSPTALTASLHMFSTFLQQKRNSAVYTFFLIELNILLSCVISPMYVQTLLWTSIFNQSSTWIQLRQIRNVGKLLLKPTRAMFFDDHLWLVPASFAHLLFYLWETQLWKTKMLICSCLLSKLVCFQAKRLCKSAISCFLLFA